MKGFRWTAPLLSAIVVGALFGPAFLHLSSRFLGLEYVDHYGTQWFYWFVEHQLRTGQGVGFTDLFYHPWGKDIFLHTGSNVIDGYGAMPFRWLFGPVLGYNLFVLVSLTLTAVAFGRLAREYTDDRTAIVLSSVLFAVSPFVLFELSEGRPTQAILLFPVLFLFYVLRAGRNRGPWAPLMAGAVLALCGYQYWFYAFFGGMVCLGHGVWCFLRPAQGSGGRWAVLGRHALIAVVALVLTAPVAVPLLLLTSGSGNEVPGLIDTQRWSLLASPPITSAGESIGLFVWQPLLRYAGAFRILGEQHTEVLDAQGLMVPLVSWVAFALYLLRPGRLSRGMILTMALVAVLIAMGPIVVAGSLALPNAPYVFLVKSVGFLRRLWWPARALAFLCILLGLANTMVLAWAGTRGRVVQVAAAVLLSGAWLLEIGLAGLVPFPSWEGAIPAGYRCLAKGPPGAVVEWPYAWTQAHLYFQTAHGRPILGGMVENNPLFAPPGFIQLLDRNRFLTDLYAVAESSETETEWTEGERRELYDLGYRYVVEQKDALFHARENGVLIDNVMRVQARVVRRALVQMLGPPVWEDARIAIYAPWGDPAPCGADDVVKDTKTLGLTELAREDRPARMATRDRPLHRIRRDEAAYQSDVAPVETVMDHWRRTGPGSRDVRPEDGAQTTTPVKP